MSHDMITFDCFSTVDLSLICTVAFFILFPYSLFCFVSFCECVIILYVHDRVWVCTGYVYVHMCLRVPLKWYKYMSDCTAYVKGFMWLFQCANVHVSIYLSLCKLVCVNSIDCPPAIVLVMTLPLSWCWRQPHHEWGWNCRFFSRNPKKLNSSCDFYFVIKYKRILLSFLKIQENISVQECTDHWMVWN